MRTILFIVQKEFLQVFRNRTMLPLLFVIPFVQLLILPHAADYEIRNINLVVVDQDHSALSMRLAARLDASPYFRVVDMPPAFSRATPLLDQNRADLILSFPPNMEKDLLRGEGASIHLAVDAINGSKALVAQGYAQSIIRSELPQEMPVSLTFSNWYNPELDYDTFMVPGILVLLVTMIGAFLTSMNVVKEKEVGNIEQINVTPIRKFQFLTGKLLPFWIIGLVEFTIGLILGKVLFHIPLLGSIGLLYLFTAVYLILVLGLGLLISTFADTQQQAMFIAWFILVIFILMSGLFTPIESMPAWAQTLTRFNPIAYFVEVIRLVMLKGSGFQDIATQFWRVLALALALNGLAVWNYRKVGV